MVILYPQTEKTEQWLDHNVEYDDWQLMGESGIAMETRMAIDIIEGLKEDDFKCGKDFTVKRG